MASAQEVEMLRRQLDELTAQMIEVGKDFDDCEFTLTDNLFFELTTSFWLKHFSN